MRVQRQTRSYRWSVASRVLAASFGGYSFVSLLAGVLALLLPMPRLEAVLTACMVCFLAYPAIIVAVFHSRSATRAWGWLVGAAAPLGVVTLLLRPWAGT